MSWQQPPDMGDWAANKDLVVDGKVRAALASGVQTPERRQQGKRQNLSPGLQESRLESSSEICLEASHWIEPWREISR